MYNIRAYLTCILGEYPVFVYKLRVLNMEILQDSGENLSVWFCRTVDYRLPQFWAGSNSQQQQRARERRNVVLIG